MTRSLEPIADASTEPAAIFLRDGERLAPQLFAQGPWNPHHLHGGAICGVLARAIERCESPVPMRVVRMTVEMTRPVPMEPFDVHAEVTRAGRRIQQIDACLAAGGTTLARATALRMRLGDGAAGAAIPAREPVPDRAARPAGSTERGIPFLPGFIRALDFLRTRIPAHGEDGVLWTRLRVPLVEGEPVTPFVRLATLATSRAAPAMRSTSPATRRSTPISRCTCCASRAASGSGSRAGARSSPTASASRTRPSSTKRAPSRALSCRCSSSRAGVRRPSSSCGSRRTARRAPGGRRSVPARAPGP